MRVFLLLTLFLIGQQPILAQSIPIKQWDKSYGGSEDDQLRVFIQTSDGGYILGGSSASGISVDKTQPNLGYRDYWVVKIDSEGNKTWDKTYGGSGYDDITAVLQTSDGGYLLGGNSNSGIGGDKTSAKGSEDFWVIKVDSNGNKLWDKTYGGVLSESLYTMKMSLDGNYLLVGRSESGISGDKTQASKGSLDAWVVKIDPLGNKLWDKAFGGNLVDAFTSVYQTLNGEYIFGGSSSSGISGDKTQPNIGNNDYWIVKLDVNGNKLWDKTFGGSRYDNINRLVPTLDGGYLIIGNSNSGIGGDKSQANRDWGLITYDIWIVKIDSNGIKQWDKTIGGSGEESISSIYAYPDGSFLLGGTSNSPISGDKTEASIGLFDYWLVKIDSVGNKDWDKSYGGSANDYLINIMQISSKGYMFAGYSQSGVSGDKTQISKGKYDYWLLKLNPICSDLTATITADCNSANGKLIVNFTGLQGTVSGSTPWTLNYTIDGVTQTSTGDSSSFTIALSSTIGSVYSLTNISSGACSKSLNSSLIVQNVPSAPIVASGVRCGPGILTLSATGAPSGGSYNWYNGATSVVPLYSSNSTSFTSPVLNTTTTYYVAISNSGGCEGPRTPVTVTINPLPVVNVGSPLTICSTAAPFQLSGFSPLGGTWSGPGVNATGLFTPNNSLVGSQLITYSVTQNGCTSSATQTINVAAEPVVNAGSNQTICSDASSFQLTGFTPSGGNWTGSGVTSTGYFTPNSSLAGVQTLTYTVTQNGCIVSATKQVTISTPLAKPVINLIAPDTLIASVVGASYEWFRTGVLLATTTRKLKMPGTGTYSVKVKDAFNCYSPLSNDYAFTFTGIKELKEHADIKIYPNPSKGIFSIEMPEGLKGNFLIEVQDLFGKTLATKLLELRESFPKQINLSHLPKGIYLLRFTSEKGLGVKKIIID